MRPGWFSCPLLTHTQREYFGGFHPKELAWKVPNALCQHAGGVGPLMSRVEAAASALGETTEIGQTGAPQGMGPGADFWGVPVMFIAVPPTNGQSPPWSLSPQQAEPQ